MKLGPFVAATAAAAVNAFVVPPSATAGGVRAATAFAASARTGSTRLFSAVPAPNGVRTDYDAVCDVLVLGSGPAGRAIASLMASAKGGVMDVILADQNFDREWAPNYGVWQDEWQTVVDRYSDMGVSLAGGKAGQAIDRQWDVTDCFFGGSYGVPTDTRLRLNRPYCRVDKLALARSLNNGTYRILKANHRSEAVGINMYQPAGSVLHDDQGTTIQLYAKPPSNIPEDEDDDPAATTPINVRAKIVVDTTGHETKLVIKDARDPYTSPGFQIAYGALVQVDESDSPNLDLIGPYNKEAMTLFDYRTDHFEEGSIRMKTAVDAPTFNYAMPLQDNLVFFEETSLVARPAMSFQECKERLALRLKYHGVKVTNIIEEEFCYIPMGGALPQRDQRILGFGGAAAMVHPSTGYHLCRALMGATWVVEAITREMEAPGTDRINRAVAAGYNAIWTPENIRQRNFAVFGGEFLMKQDVVGLRGFFDGFFRLPVPLWGGFLAGWPGLPYNDRHESWFARLWFGLSFVVKLPLPVAFDMAFSIVAYSLTEGVALPQAVTPFFGAPKSYEYKRNSDRLGDIPAKMEAMSMIEKSTSLPRQIPVALEEK